MPVQREFDRQEERVGNEKELRKLNIKPCLSLLTDWRMWLVERVTW